MKIQICSDLHLEFSQNRKWLKEHPLQPKGDILIIAGDTYYLNRNYAKLDFIKKCSDEFEQVYLIPGNHEYYEGFDVSTGLKPYELDIKDNVKMLNNKAVEIGKVKLIFSTFWSLITANIAGVTNSIVDFRRIKFKEEDLSVDHFNVLHHKAFEWVSNELQDHNRNIVVSHHLPSSRCVSAEFVNSPFGEAFCVDKTNFIAEQPIEYWIYGHSHRNLSDFSIGDTKMITNQFGYVGWNEHKFFQYDKVVEVKDKDTDYPI